MNSSYHVSAAVIKTDLPTHLEPVVLVKNQLGFSSCCCLASALHPIKWQHPQTTAEFNKAWNSTSSLAKGQILHSEHRDAETACRGMLPRFAAGVQSPAALDVLPVCPQRSTSSGITTWVLCYSVTPSQMRPQRMLYFYITFHQLIKPSVFQQDVFKKQSSWLRQVCAAEMYGTVFVWAHSQLSRP